MQISGYPYPLQRVSRGREKKMENLSLIHILQIEHKYNEFIPPVLLRKEFVEDFLDLDGLKKGLILEN